MSANITTLLRDYFSGRTCCRLRARVFFSSRYCTTRAGRNPKIEKFY
jgi:hypothetical protein